MSHSEVNITLDDGDVEKRNEALLTEVDILKDQLTDANNGLMELAKRVATMNGVTAVGILDPAEVTKLFTAIQAAIEAFVEPMDQSIRRDNLHKNKIMTEATNPGSFTGFRSGLQGDAELKAAALNPLTSIVDIWTSYIWRFLAARIFSKRGTEEFYGGQGRTPAYYLQAFDDVDVMMARANPPVFGEYSRRLWRRQGLAAIFRTADFDWVRDVRTPSISTEIDYILDDFKEFVAPIEKATARDLVKNIVTAAVRLNEYMMIEADDLWTVEIAGVTGADDYFYDNLGDFELKPVGTTVALRDNSPLETIRSRLSLDEVKKRVHVLAVLTPALRFEHIQADGNRYKDGVDLVKAQVLVALDKLPAPQGEQEIADPEPYELVFYTLAQNIDSEDPPPAGPPPAGQPPAGIPPPGPPPAGQ